jgi:hypothetical protein
MNSISSLPRLFILPPSSFVLHPFIPMDRSEFKAIVEREIEPLMERLGVLHWEITVSYDLRGEYDGAQAEAQCMRLVEYNKAWIEFDPDQFEDEEQVKRALRHELFHVVISPFDLFTAAVKTALGSEEAVCSVMERVQNHVTEKTVINLERMYQGVSQKDE